MRLSILSFFLGILTVFLFSSLLPIHFFVWVGGGVLSLLFFAKIRKKLFFQCLIFFCLGFCWNAIVINHLLEKRLPVQLENKAVLVKGVIASIPEDKPSSSNFIFNIHQMNIKARLNSSALDSDFHVGEEWMFWVKLKSPRGYRNLGGFDYEAWLFSQGISATGYILNSAQNQKISGNHFFYFINHLRQNIAETIAISVKNSEYTGLLTALAVGIRSQITEDQWHILRDTGTNHLFAIAGLHIGFISAIIFFCVNRICRYIPKVSLYFPAYKIAIIFSLLGTFVYCALAGFSLPTQRALLMLAVFLLGKIMARNLAASQALFIALFVILVCDPLITLSSSFWMSFSALAIILYSFYGRIGNHSDFFHWGKMQWVLSLGLIPITVFFFQTIALNGIIANLITIPLVGFLVLPLVVMGDVLWLINANLSEVFFQLAEKLLKLIWTILTKLDSLSFIEWQCYLFNPWVLGCAIVGVLLFLTPHKFPAKWLSAIWILPVFFGFSNGPKNNEVWITVLDCGEGLAVVVQTQQHILLYDTGASSSPNFSIADTVIIPYLKYFNISKIDTLVLSDDSAESTSGLQILYDKFPIESMMTSQPELFKPSIQVKACAANDNWIWDGIHFEVMNPVNQNFSSTCVLRITVGGQSAILTHNMTEKDENLLVSQATKSSQSQILIAPHHGVLNSSSQTFINFIKPEYAIFSVANDNRFNLPNEIVLQRYQNAGSKVLITAKEGMIQFKLTKDSVKLITYMNNYKKIWNG